MDGKRLRAWRERDGVSLGDLARRVAYDKSTLSRVENGRINVGEGHARAYREGLATEPPTTQEIAELERHKISTHLEEENMRRRQLLQGTATLLVATGTAALLTDAIEGRVESIGSPEIDNLELVWRSLLHTGNALGGAAILAQASSLADQSASLARLSVPMSRSKDLFYSLCRINSLASWAAGDANQSHLANTYVAREARYAYTSNDPDRILGAQFGKAQILYGQRHYEAAGDLALHYLSSYEKKDSNTTFAEPLLHFYAAAGRAVGNDAPSAMRHLGRAQELLEKYSNSESPGYSNRFIQAEALSHQAMIERFLGIHSSERANKAVELLQGSITAYTPLALRGAAYDNAQQVVALFLAERPDEAAHVGTELLRRLPTLSSPRTYEALTSAVAIEGAPYRHQREVLDLQDALHATTATFTPTQL